MIEKLVSTLLILVVVMTISGVFKELQVMGSVYGLLQKSIKSKRVLVAIISLIFGVIPIPSRISFTCGMLDSVQDKNKNNQKMGTIAFLASHHYYLWSPIEKSIIIVCGVLGISYIQFMSYMWVPALIAILFSIVYIFASVTEDEIYLTESKGTPQIADIMPVLVLFIAIVLSAIIPQYSLVIFTLYALCLVDNVKHFSIKWIDFKVLLMAAASIVLGSLIGLHDTRVLSIVNWATESTTIITTVTIAFILSFVLGSSAKYAAICGLIVKFIGIKYLPLIYLVEYAGYLLSPTHACVPIAKSYFKTPIGMFFLPLMLLGIILITYGSLVTLLK